MSFCPRCGAATTPGMSFCTACGENLPAVPVAPPATLAPGAPPGATPLAAGPTGPVGKRVHPAAAAILAFIFSGIYPLWFWWRTSREMDAYRGPTARPSHPLVRGGVALSAAAVVLSIAIAAIVSQDLDLTTVLQDEGVQVAAERFTTAVAEHPWTPAQVGLSILGAGVLYAGLWRLWNAIREEDERRRRSPTFDPRLALAILAGGTLLPLLSYVVTDAAMLAVIDLVVLVLMIGALFVVYQVQARLNEVWRSTPPPAAGAHW